MTELQVLRAPAPSQEPPQALETASAPPILITEHDVTLGSAAALGVQPKRIRWWNRVNLALSGALRPSSAFPTAKPRQKPRDVPRRYVFLEDALMAREMDRL